MLLELLPIRSHSLFLSEFLVDSNIIDFIDFIDNTTYTFFAFEPRETTQQIDPPVKTANNILYQINPMVLYVRDRTSRRGT